MIHQTTRIPKCEGWLLGFVSILPLLIASLAPAGMVLAVVLYTGQYTHISLLWNLFLAWIPLLLAVSAWRNRFNPFAAAIFGILWLIFLPNAFYLVTDLIHLSPIVDTPMMWFELGMYFSFAFVGTALGLHSLHTMRELVNRRFTSLLGWVFILAAATLSGFGIYIGRFLRWNSWDVFLHPIGLATDVVTSFTAPGSVIKLTTVVLLFGALTITGLLLVPTYRTAQ